MADEPKAVESKDETDAQRMQRRLADAAQYAGVLDECNLALMTPMSAGLAIQLAAAAGVAYLVFGTQDQQKRMLPPIQAIYGVLLKLAEERSGKQVGPMILDNTGRPFTTTYREPMAGEPPEEVQIPSP